jgi:hypothetical protein
VTRTIKFAAILEKPFELGDVPASRSIDARRPLRIGADFQSTIAAAAQFQPIRRSPPSASRPTG